MRRSAGRAIGERDVGGRGAHRRRRSGSALVAGEVRGEEPAVLDQPALDRDGDVLARQVAVVEALDGVADRLQRRVDLARRPG